MSTAPIRQRPVRTANEQRNTHSGPTPTERVSTDGRPTRSEISAANATSGASAHSIQLTRLGCARPWSIALQ